MIGKLMKAIEAKQAPIVVGLDPMLDYIPSFIKEKAFAEFGETPEGASEAVLAFNRGIVEAVRDLVPAVKPQIAMYEQFGVPGMRAFAETVRLCREAGLIVIGDAKRGDIGSTSAAYASAHIGRTAIGSGTFSAFDEDFVTVNPYLGTDGIKPFLDVMKKEDRGIFVLVKTSNPSSGEFQNRLVDGEPLYALVADKVKEWGSVCMDASPCAHGYSDVGAVIGATYPEEGKQMRERMPNTFFLVPGYGAQGGKGKDLAEFFDRDGRGVIVNSSRGIIAAWKSAAYESYGEAGYADASRAAVLAMQKDLLEALDR